MAFITDATGTIFAVGQKGENMDDLISRQEAIRWVKTECNPYGKPTLGFESGKKVIEHLKQMPSAQQWHVIKKRPMTNDEHIEWSEKVGYDIEYEDAFIYSNLPDDGEEVLVSSQYGNVYVDKFCQDEGCYFEENGDMDGIVAWMPLPEPYKED